MVLSFLGVGTLPPTNMEVQKALSKRKVVFLQGSVRTNPCWLVGGSSYPFGRLGSIYRGLGASMLV